MKHAQLSRWLKSLPRMVAIRYSVAVIGALLIIQIIACAQAKEEDIVSASKEARWCVSSDILQVFGQWFYDKS